MNRLKRVVLDFEQHTVAFKRVHRDKTFRGLTLRQEARIEKAMRSKQTCEEYDTITLHDMHKETCLVAFCK